MPDALHFTGNAEADRLIAAEPLALLIGFVLDQQVTVPTAFAGPLKLQQRLGGIDAAAIAGLDPDRLLEVFRMKPGVHRFPGSMAKRVQELCAVVVEEYGGDAARVWRDAAGTEDLKRRIEALPGFGEMKVKALASVLARRYGLEIAEPLVPDHPMLGDVDSPEALAEYQAAKRAYKAQLRADSA
ncbi:MAG: DNA repair protein [Actinomycetota bacterium]|nr:DNA repair protein [Actinomycetota bacterium]